ncbi:syntaxin-1A homolog isoform X2 [Ruditapes philippinarum]|jgi:t-SNARE complex subunit (syntaxin)|nr:syntaxin-1A homolog isoform X2 [Ruditapes philippinarum]
MVRDRLAEMQAKSAEVGESKHKKNDSNGTPLLNSEQQLEECLKWVTSVDNKVKTMKEEIEQMQKLQKNIISNPLVDVKEVKKLEQTSDKVFNESSKLQKEISAYRSEFANMHLDGTHERMIKTHIDRLGSDVTKTMHDFRAAQLEYIQKTQKLHNRKYEIVTGNEAGSSADVDPSDIQAVFAGDYFAEAQKAKMELREIEARDAEIKKIENSVVQVNQLFKEINALVMEQGEKIDNIEKHVNAASVDVESGNVQLKQAREHQSKARKKKICCIGILVAVLLIAGVIITIVIVSQNSNN